MAESRKENTYVVYFPAYLPHRYFAGPYPAHPPGAGGAGCRELRYDTILGRADLWDGRYIEARLCGRPGQTALLAVVLYDFGGELQTYRNSTEYQTGFEFTHEGMEFIVGFVPEERRKRHE